MSLRGVTISIAAAAMLVAFAQGVGADETKERFDRTVAPLLAARCLKCHNGGELEGGLDLSSRDSALQGGDSGAALLPGDALGSLLFERVTAEEMPPKLPLTDEEKKLLRRWLDAGAMWGTDPINSFRYTSDHRAGYDWWALQPVVEVPVPGGTDATPSADKQNAIDAFIAAKRREMGLGSSPQADRRTLIRRISFDLLGLPPTSDEVATFVSDESPAAYERLVDRLLASPAYGERWTRHWLDVARFGESQGFERDKLRSNSWRYRDWLIEAFNTDLPYDEFVRQQLAGDVLYPDNAPARIATGFLVAGAYDEVGQSQQSAAMKAVVRQDELEDIVSVVGQTFLGMTINCARCHDHKFDPVTQKEYYQLTAALAGVRHGQREAIDDTVAASAISGIQYVAARVRGIEDRLAAIEDPVRERLLAQQTAIADSMIVASLSAEQQLERSRLQFEREQLRSQQTRYDESTVYAVTPRPPGLSHFLVRGNTGQKGEVVAAGGVASLEGVDASFELPADAPDAARRKKLAAWITDQQNPLFARVLVNRLWHYHFGVGLVDTPNDFGFNGGRPTHPELIDYLANELQERGWSMKSIHRLIVTSATYRQSSRFDTEKASIDAGNRFLWRKTPRRLEAETIRDTILTISGELNPTMYGPGYHDFRTFTFNSQFYEMLDPVGATFNRRSLYRTWVRSGRNQFLDVFDCPDPSAKAPKRAVTTTPLQALSMLNNSFVLRMADHFSSRIEASEKVNERAQCREAYRLAFGRSPSENELRATEAFVQQHGLAALCRVIFNSNEFLYVD